MKPSTKPVLVPFGGRSVEFGGNTTVLIAGPCSVESEQQLLQTALAVREAGACFLRGGVFKMRTNPNSFQGLGEEALRFLPNVTREAAMPIVSEIVDPRQIDGMHDAVDMFQVGARSMYNYALLRELGATTKPVLLKRGLSATVEEWLLAAEYIAKGGNSSVVLCERGIRTFETSTRNTLDLNSVAYIKAHSPWPVIVDPSHGTGRPELIGPMSMAAIAAGADGLIIEVHPRPKEAKSDGFQALDFDAFRHVTVQAAHIANAVGRPFAAPIPHENFEQLAPRRVAL